MSYHKFCSQCGSPLEPGDEFCVQCGFKLSGFENGVITPPDANNPANNIEPLYEKKKSPKAIVFVIIILLIALSAATAYYFLKKDNPNIISQNKSKSPNNVTSTSQTQSGDVADSTIESQSSSQQKTSSPVESIQKIDYTAGSTYIPSLNKKYSYHYKYVDGDEQDFSALVGKLPSSVPIVTITNLYPDSEALTQHIVKRNDGLYIVTDENPDIFSPYLPNSIIDGTSWLIDGITISIEKTNEFCDAGFKKFDHCIVVKRDYPKTGYAFRVWYAPGFGEVKSVDADSNQPYGQLTGVSDVPEKEINAQLAKYSPNIDKIK
jgi:hypothetical protein